MNNRNLSPLTRTTRNMDPTAAGTGDTITGTEIDTQGYEACRIIVVLGVMAAGATATMSVKATDVAGTYGAGAIDSLQLPDSSGTVATLVGTGAGDTKKCLIFEVFRPKRRYLRPQIVRAGGANATIDSIVVELYNPQNSIQTMAAADGYGVIVQGNKISAA